jgi:hypothetical protein
MHPHFRFKAVKSLREPLPAIRGRERVPAPAAERRLDAVVEPPPRPRPYVWVQALQAALNSQREPVTTAMFTASAKPLFALWAERSNLPVYVYALRTRAAMCFRFCYWEV